MDEFTLKTKAWLDQRFKGCSPEGIYGAHQPIYGFRKNYCEPVQIDRRYIPTYQIMRALAHLRFDTLLDVGGAEGYAAALVRELFGVKAESCDLSEEACQRAREIYALEATPADMHALPFGDAAFDVVLSSMTLEHVADPDKAVAELLRVASKAAVIAVPHEPHEVIEKEIEEQVPHGHIRTFDLAAFDFLRSSGHHLISRKMGTPLLKIPKLIVEGMPREYIEGVSRKPRILFDIFNASVPFLRKALDKRAAAFLVWLDGLLCNFVRPYAGVLVVVLKDRTCYTRRPTRHVSATRIVGFTVPYHYLGENRY